MIQFDEDKQKKQIKDLFIVFIVFIGVFAYVLFTNGFKNLQNQPEEYTLSPQTIDTINTTASGLDALAGGTQVSLQTDSANMDAKKIDADAQENLSRQKKASALGTQSAVPERTNQFNP